MPRHSKPKSQGNSTPYAVRRTTLLPSSLREELVSLGRLQGSSRDAAGSDATSVVGRKQRRKAERKSTSQKPVNSNGKPTPATAVAAKKAASKVDVKGKKRAVEPDAVAEKPANSKKRKRSKKDADQETAMANNTTQSRKVDPNTRTPLQKLLEKTQDGAGSSSNGKAKVVKPQGFRNAAEEQEDAEIAWLEYKLGMTGRKEIQEDGLDGKLDQN